MNSHDEVVGVYTALGQHGHDARLHLDPAGRLPARVDDPHGMGTTTINGVNDFGVLVGFYVDANGNTDGFVATP